MNGRTGKRLVLLRLFAAAGLPGTELMAGAGSPRAKRSSGSTAPHQA